MYDSIDVSTVPAGAKVVAGYTAGYWPTYLGLVKAFPHAVHISIAISARFRADCLDVEPGDAVPSEVVAWIKADRAAGFARPCVYSSLWEFRSQIIPLIVAAHIPRSSIVEWDADYTYVAHIDAGFDGTQYTDRALGRNLDASLVTPALVSVGDGRVVAPKPKPVRPHCFGPHARVKLAACKRARADVGRLSHERDALLVQVAHDVKITVSHGKVVFIITPAGRKLETLALAVQKRIDAVLY